MKRIIKAMFILLGIIAFGSQAAYRASNANQEIARINERLEMQTMRQDHLEKEIEQLSKLENRLEKKIEGLFSQISQIQLEIERSAYNK